MTQARPWKSYPGGKAPRPPKWRHRLQDAVLGGLHYTYDGPDIRKDHVYIAGRWIPSNEAWMWADDQGRLVRSEEYQEHIYGPTPGLVYAIVDVNRGQVLASFDSLHEARGEADQLRRHDCNLSVVMVPTCHSAVTVATEAMDLPRGEIEAA